MGKNNNESERRKKGWIEKVEEINYWFEFEHCSTYFSSVFFF